MVVIAGEGIKHNALSLSHHNILVRRNNSNANALASNQNKLRQFTQEKLPPLKYDNNNNQFKFNNPEILKHISKKLKT